jgi:hypothetical protein
LGVDVQAAEIRPEEGPVTLRPKNLRVDTFDTESLQVGTNAGVRDSSLLLGLLLPVGPDSDLDAFESRSDFSGSQVGIVGAVSDLETKIVYAGEPKVSDNVFRLDGVVFVVGFAIVRGVICDVIHHVDVVEVLVADVGNGHAGVTVALLDKVLRLNDLNNLGTFQREAEFYQLRFINI